MSNRAIVSGVLYRDPAQKTSKAGKPYVVATIRSGSGERVCWWKVFVFNETASEEIMRLRDGEPIVVSGEFGYDLYAPAGRESRLDWKITVEGVLGAKAKLKTRLKKEKEPKALMRPSGPAPQPSNFGGPNDELPV